MAPTPVDVPAFATAQLALLDAEVQAEAAETAALVGAHSPAALQRAGVALTNLLVGSARTGLGGKTVVELVPDPATASASAPSTAPGASSGGGGGGEPELPAHGIRVGDLVLVAELAAGGAKKREVRELEKKGARGVVTKVGRAAVAVALDGGGGGGDGDQDRDDVVAAWSGRVWMVKLADEVTYKRMNGTMEKLQKMTESDYSPFMRVLFGLSSPSPVPADLSADPEFGNIDWIDPTLNDSQKDAIRFALASKDIALIHGPPGTGKTHTLIELILQMVKRGQRILVCGPSNISVDNIVERLAPHKVPMVRLGHPARLLPSVLSHSLDVLTRTSDAAAIVRDVRADMDARQAAARKARNARDRRAVYAELRDLRKEYRARERKCVADLVAASRVVLATLHGAGGFQLRGERFDVVVVDEASQALEAQCWVALLAAEKAVCAGDHLQLPPTIKSLNSSSTSTSKTKTKTKAQKGKGNDDNGKLKGGGGSDGGASRGEETAAAKPTAVGTSLETTLFDRLLALHGPAIKRMLTTQYRMHEAIMRFPSDELYESRLVAAEGVRARLLRDLPYGVAATDDTSEPLVFIDTQGGDFPEANEDADSDANANAKLSKSRLLMHGESKSNPMEAALVRQHVGRLVAAGVRAEDIAVVTPYNAQLGVLAPLKEAFPGIELGSVDGFQGREKEAVVVSLVRSNPDGEVGFLGEKRRLNVAMTRPKRSLTVIGDSETVKKGSKFLKKWMDFLENNADLRYPDPSSLNEE